VKRPALNWFPKNLSTSGAGDGMVFSIAIVKAFLLAKHYMH